MKTLRWFGITWPCSMFTLAKRLGKYPFEGERNAGVVVDRARPDHLEGRYFERIAFQETVRDPRGAEFHFDRIVFNSLEFRCSVSFPQLQIADSPRSTKSFVNLLAQAADFEMTVDAITVDVKRWMKEIESRLPAAFLCEAVRLSEFPISEHAKARVEVISSRDVRKEADLMFKARNLQYDRAQIRLMYLNEPISLVLKQNAALRSENGFPSGAAVPFRDALTASWDGE